MLAITGTPGAGKTTVAEILKRRGYRVAHLNEIAEQYGCLFEEDGDLLIDVEMLSEKFDRSEFNFDFVEGHLSHHIAEKCVVLRCNPVVLRKRMESKGWSEDKILENIEAEIIDYILVEALQVCKEVHEVDTTSKTPEEIADIIEKIYREEENYPPGSVDWIKELGDKVEDFMRT